MLRDNPSGFETITFQPGWAFSSSMPAAAIGSAIRMFMLQIGYAGVSFDRFLFRDSDFGIHLLNGGDARSQRHRNAVGMKDQFQLRDHREQIGEIEISQMRDPENLPFIEPCPLAMIEPKRLRNSLTITPESMPGGAFTAVTEAAGIIRRRTVPGPAPGRPLRVARASCSALSISLSMPMVLMYFSASSRPSIREVAGVQLDSPVAAFFFSFFEIEIEVRKLGSFHHGPRFRADRQERHARRHHERLLRAANDDIEPPAVDIERHGARDR